ncbi:hypothetical protein, partial [Blautia producta]|uniref:hypothetical protein n=1 Tax=Blautia producta TaxID=33035 RepID=UPI001A9AF178
IIDPNIKMALNVVKERDSKNPTPTIDIEPKKQGCAADDQTPQHIPLSALSISVHQVLAQL